MMTNVTNAFAEANRDRIARTAAAIAPRLTNDVRRALNANAHDEDLASRYQEFWVFAECATPHLRLLLAVTAALHLIEGTRRILAEEAACAIADLAVVPMDLAHTLWGVIAPHLQTDPDTLSPP